MAQGSRPTVDCWSWAGTSAGTEQSFTMSARADQWLNLARELAGPTLSQVEWNTYVGADRPFQNLC